MRTFKVLLVGWFAGGAFLVLLGASGSAKPARRPATEPVEVERAVPRRGLLVPVQGITNDQLRDNYGEARGGGRVHGALDILAPRGTPVVACVDGTIRKLFTSRAGGLTIYQFDRGEARVYYYAHLDRYARGLREGMFVAQGTVIGYVGTSGNAPSTTPHLHFAIEDLPPTKEWWKGTPVNPYPLLNAP